MQDMEHQGKYLQAIIKAKGFTIQALSREIGKARTAIQNDISHDTVSRKVIKRYADKLGFDIDDFFNKKVNGVGAVVIDPTDKSEKEVIKLQRQLIEEQRKRLDLQDSILRFFPNAAQWNTLTFR